MERLASLEHSHRGKPKALSCIQEKAFVHIVTSRSHDNAISAVRDVKNKLDVIVNDSIICRILKRTRLSSQAKQKILKLTHKHIRDH